MPPVKSWAEIIRSEEYRKYHRAVVKECVRQTDPRMFRWFNGMRFEESFIEREEPKVVAADQVYYSRI